MVIDRFVDPPGRRGTTRLDSSGAAAPWSPAAPAASVGPCWPRRWPAPAPSVVIHYRTSEDDARQAVAAIEAAGGEAYTLRADLASSDVDIQLVDEAARWWGSRWTSW